MAAAPTEVCNGESWPDTGRVLHGQVTARLVGHPFQMIRPALSASRSSSSGTTSSSSSP